jgi:hypothetical protein
MERNDWIMSAGLAAFLAACGVAIGIAVHIENERILVKQGCHVYFQAETGARIQAGGMSHAEVVTVYECADGKRTELHTDANVTN